MPKVSIIVPLYNKAPYVTKALESIASQTFTDWECIIVNDGSTDNSLEVAETWLTENIDENWYSIGGHWRLITQENAGVSAARNHGISLSTGDFVAFLDADDWWAPTFLEEMMQLADEYPNAGLYAGNYWYYKPGKTHVAVKKVYGVEYKVYEEEGWGGYMNYPRTYCEGEMPVWTGAVLIPRAILEEVKGKNEEVRTKCGVYFPLGIKLGEDFLLWSKIALQYKVAFLNKSLAYYNNDIPASLRLTRHLHAPETHMLWHLGEIEDRIQNIEGEKQEIENRIQNIDDWKLLLDKLRVKGLQKYWLSNQYHAIAKKELEKVDWDNVSSSMKRWYKTPIFILNAWILVQTIGSYIKQRIIKIVYTK